MTLLISHKKQKWVEPKPPQNFDLCDVYVGAGGISHGLQVVTAKWTGTGEPNPTQLKNLYKLRTGDRGTPVVVAVEVDSTHAVLVGHNSDWPPTPKIEQSLIARILEAALADPNPIAARERITMLREALDTTALPGLKNSGLFANHELAVGVPKRPDFSSACAKSVPMLALQHKPLLSALGFTTEAVGGNAELLRGSGKNKLAVAVVLQDSEMFNVHSNRLHGLPVAQGLAIAEEHGVSWIILMRRTKIRLYPARVDLGVGRKGPTETFLELDLPFLSDSNAGYLSLIFSADALAESGTAFQIMDSSWQFAVGLGQRLRDKVYEEIIPSLSLAVAKSVKGRKHAFTPEMLTIAYEMTLRIFFRILFQVYAEDRKLLPLGENPSFDKLALKTLSRELAVDRTLYTSNSASDLWARLSKVWKAIDEGSSNLGIPAYNGGLFSGDKDLHPENSAIDDITIADDVMGPVLRSLLLDVGDAGTLVPIDFRSLGVREFGTIYEGLLESSLGIAETDLTLDDDKNWVPAKKKSDEIFAPEGSVYFHNTSGQRKGTGSYFTPSFVVEHLLERSLDPALDAHLSSVAELLAKGDEASATDKFFDFRVADLAMGSGHFLTAAIDHIEKKMAIFLANPEHPLPGVQKEILELEAAAKDAVGIDGPEIDRSSLLRRQIARRCVYGLDLNPIAVELARVSIWIHTFVRGLPMSSLDHNLVCGNSLTGIGSIDEALDVLVPSRLGKGKGRNLDKTNITIEEILIERVLGEARETLLEASNSLELNKAESRASAKAAKKAKAQAVKALRLFDAAVLRRIGREGLVASEDIDEVIRLAGEKSAQSAIAPLAPVHFPATFPEVFSRERGGFDVLVGNPPWEEVMVEEPKYWLRFQPGLLGLDAADLKSAVIALRKKRPELIPGLESEIETAADIRKVLLAGPFPGLGTGDVDLYRVFAWRNWQLLRSGGHMGAVFPRTLLNAAGNAHWREEVLSHGEVNVVTVTNSAEWVFKSVDGRYSITFIDIHKIESTPETVQLSGPFFDYKTFDEGRHQSGALPIALLKTASEGASFPQLPDVESASVFTQIRLAPRLNDPRHPSFRPVTEFHATNDRPTFDAGPQKEGRWPVLGGSGFNLWEPNTGDVYTWAEPKKVIAVLQEKRQRQIQLKSSAFFGMDETWAANPDTLPCSGVRIAFRDITNATNTRTCIAALLPPEVILTNKAPYLLRNDCTSGEEAYLLGVLCSIPLDWYARRYVELSMNLHIFNGLPIPLVDENDSRRLRIIQIAGMLAAVDNRYATWAKEVGVKVASVKTESAKEELIAELDALVSHLYGLTRPQVEHVFETFHRGWVYTPRLTKVLEFYDQLPKVKS